MDSPVLHCPLTDLRHQTSKRQEQLRPDHRLPTTTLGNSPCGIDVSGDSSERHFIRVVPNAGEGRLSHSTLLCGSTELPCRFPQDLRRRYQGCLEGGHEGMRVGCAIEGVCLSKIQPSRERWISPALSSSARTSEIVEARTRQRWRSCRAERGIPALSRADKTCSRGVEVSLAGVGDSESDDTTKHTLPPSSSRRSRSSGKEGWARCSDERIIWLPRRRTNKPASAQA